MFKPKTNIYCRKVADQWIIKMGKNTIITPNAGISRLFRFLCTLLEKEGIQAIDIQIKRSR